MFRRLLPFAASIGMVLCLVSTSWAQTPPMALGSNPPVFQNIGMLDTTTEFLTADVCRECHDSGVPDRHHMLYGETIPDITVVPYPGGDTYSCLSCHGQNFVVERDCKVCHSASTPHHSTQEAFDRHCTECHGDLVADYDDGHYIPTYAASYVTPKRSLTGEGFYADGTPHTESTGEGLVDLAALPSGPVTRHFPNALEFVLPGLNNDFTVTPPRGSTYDVTVEFHEGALAATYDTTDPNERFLDVYIPVPASATANEVVQTINAAAGNICSLGFDGPADALLPYYDYQPKGGAPPNNRGFDAGACSYCHWDDGATDVNGDPAPVLILNNHDNHHGANLPGNVNDGSGGTWSRCNVCHDYSGRPVPHLDPGRPNDPTYHDVGGPGFELAIRICEECHSVATLHNIQADTNGDGVITVGGELAGYGHVGKDGGPGDSDCWGCHGFQAAGSSVPFTGPLVPTLYNADVATISAGKDTTLLLSGASFTNTANGKSYVSDVRLTGANGTSVTLTPDVVLDQGSLAVTIPAATQPGNYKLQAAKGNMASNPTVISVTPKVTINRATARRTTVTITGSGFAGYASGSGTAVTSGKVRGSEPVEATIISWTDTRIIVRFPTLPTTVTVHSVFGSVTARIASR